MSTLHTITYETVAGERFVHKMGNLTLPDGYEVNIFTFICLMPLYVFEHSHTVTETNDVKLLSLPIALKFKSI